MNDGECGKQQIHPGADPVQLDVVIIEVPLVLKIDAIAGQKVGGDGHASGQRGKNESGIVHVVVDHIAPKHQPDPLGELERGIGAVLELSDLALR